MHIHMYIKIYIFYLKKQQIVHKSTVNLNQRHALSMLLFSASRFLDLLSSFSLCEDFEEVLVSELALPFKTTKVK